MMCKNGKNFSEILQNILTIWYTCLLYTSGLLILNILKTVGPTIAPIIPDNIIAKTVIEMCIRDSS